MGILISHKMTIKKTITDKAIRKFICDAVEGELKIAYYLTQYL